MRQVRIVCALLLAPMLGLAAPLTVEEVVTLKSVVDAKLSPDGNRIAYLLNVPRTPYVDDDGSAYRELHVTDLAGRSRGYVTGDMNVVEITWSADGAVIYYTAERDDDEHRALYTIPIDGGESQRLYEHVTDMRGLRRSPDGRHLAFRAIDPPPGHSEELADKGFKARVYAEAERLTDVWLLDLEAEKLEAVAADLPGDVSALEWSADGGRYVVAMAPTALVDDSYVSRQLSIVEAASGRVLRRIDHQAKLGAFAWSPDGDRIAFIGGEDRNDPLEGRIFVATLDGEQVENVTPDYPGHVHEIVWHDADTLLFRGSRGLWVELHELSLDAGMTPSTWTVSGGEPVVREISAQPGIERLAVVADSAAHPAEVYVYESATGLRRLTDSNPWLAERDLARQEDLRYQARDGLMIEGVLVRPLNERRGRRHPAVIAVHGGPESHYSHGWMSGYTFPAQAMAAQGFAFFYPNYRGSTGSRCRVLQARPRRSSRARVRRSRGRQELPRRYWSCRSRPCWDQRWFLRRLCHDVGRDGLDGTSPRVWHSSVSRI